MRMLDEQVAAMLERLAADVRAGEITVESWSVEDVEHLDVKVRCAAGPKALARAEVERVEGERADAGMDAPTGAPGPAERCSSCGALGTLRDAGGLARLCIACNAETTPP